MCPMLSLTRRTLAAVPEARAIVLAACAMIAATACAGKSEATTPTSATAGSDAGPTSAGAPGASASDPNLLMPELNPPPAEGDGRLVDIGDAQAGDGWDWCTGEPRLVRSTALPCAACPAATRGSEFVIATPAVDKSPTASGTVPQGYFFFDELTRADAVWFDALWINGSRNAKLSLWPTNPVCEPTGPARVLDLHGLFTEPGQWVTACVSLDDLQPFRGLALRIDGAGTLGVDAFRFGPPCPEP